MRRRISVFVMPSLSFRVFTFVSLFCAGMFSANSWAQTLTRPSAGDGSAGNPYQMSSLENLNWLADSVVTYGATFQGTYFIQTQNINASATSGAGYNSGHGFKPIGSGSGLRFSGSYDGQGLVVDSMFFSQTTAGPGYYIGLFGFLGSTAVIKNVGVTHANVSGYDFVGALAGGDSAGASISNCYSTGTVHSSWGDGGGLIGQNDATVSTCYSTCTVTGGSNFSMGGLVGFLEAGSITNCYSTGEVRTTGQGVGGLVGNCQANIDDCYSLSKVSTTSGATYNVPGGVAGAGFGGTISNTFWDTDSTSAGVGTVSGVTDNSQGKSSSQLQTLSTFTSAGWDFVLETANGTNDYWDMDTTSKTINNGYPFLSWQNGNVVVLPVELSSFTVSANALNAELRWTTATELNTNGWEVERRGISNFRLPNADWIKAGFVNGEGTSSGSKQYRFVDRNLQTGSYSYRLKQIDQNGSFKYSQEVRIDVGNAPRAFTLGQNYPNPFNPSTTLGFTLAVDGHVTLRVYDMTGKEVATLFDGERTAGEYQQVIFDASRLSSGTYFAVLRSGGRQLLKKMILLK